MPVWVTITDAPVYMRESGGGERGENGFRIAISVVIQYVSLTDLDRLPVWVVKTDAPVYMRE